MLHTDPQELKTEVIICRYSLQFAKKVALSYARILLNFIRTCLLVRQYTIHLFD